MAIEAMNPARSDAELRQMLKDRWLARIEHNSGMLEEYQKGLEQGREGEKRNIARRLLGTGSMSTAEIAAVTQLDEVSVIEIARETR